MKASAMTIILFRIGNGTRKHKFDFHRIVLKRNTTFYFHWKVSVKNQQVICYLSSIFLWRNVQFTWCLVYLRFSILNFLEGKLRKPNNNSSKMSYNYFFSLGDLQSGCVSHLQKQRNNKCINKKREKKKTSLGLKRYGETNLDCPTVKKVSSWKKSPVDEANGNSHAGMTSRHKLFCDANISILMPL